MHCKAPISVAPRHTNGGPFWSTPQRSDIPPSCEWIWGGITNWMHPVPVPIVIMLVLTYVGSHHHDACSRSDADTVGTIA